MFRIPVRILIANRDSGERQSRGIGNNQVDVRWTGGKVVDLLVDHVNEYGGCCQDDRQPQNPGEMSRDHEGYNDVREWGLHSTDSYREFMGKILFTIQEIRAYYISSNEIITVLE